MSNAAFELLHGVGLIVHNTRNPSREEWDAFLAMSQVSIEAVGGDLTRIKQLVFTDGGGPNGPQRSASAALYKPRGNSDRMRVAVVSRSVVVRGIITAYRWLGLPMRSFEPEQLAEAFAFLAVSKPEAVALCAAVEALCATVSGPVRSAARVAAYRTELSAGSPDAPGRDSASHPA